MNSRTVKSTIVEVVHMIYFIVSFPMFLRVDESGIASPLDVLMDSLACCMLVTIMLDWWKLILVWCIENDVYVIKLHARFDVVRCMLRCSKRRLIVL